MKAATESPKKHLDELHEVISHAMQKVHVKKETDLRHYLPGENGHIHHLRLLKLKKESPTELLKMIKNHILEKENPAMIPSQLRQARTPKVRFGRKGPVELKLSQSILKQVIEALKKTGNEALISSIDPYQSLKKVRKMLLEQIKKDKPDLTLWNTYLKLIQEKTVKTT